MSSRTVSISERVHDLQEYIRQGRILDAMNEFYDANVTMQENSNPPTIGLEANIEREKQFIAGVKEWLSYDVRSISVSADTAAVESGMEFISVDGKKVVVSQVAIQHWRNGKIVSERFYYNAA